VLGAKLEKIAIGRHISLPLRDKYRTPVSKRLDTMERKGYQAKKPLMFSIRGFL
jgi:hypothetical protein